MSDYKYRLILLMILAHLNELSLAQLDLQNNQVIYQDDAAISDSVQTDAQFGYALSARENILVIGAPRESSNGQKGGAIYQLFGNPDNGLREHPFNRRISQDTPGVAGNTEDGDRFGASIVIGYFAEPMGCGSVLLDCNGWRDIVVGVPGEDLSSNSISNAGMLNIISAGNPDCTNQGDECDALSSIHQGTSGIIGTIQDGDGFASSLAVGDFNADSADDLVVGVPYENLTIITEATDAGSINVIAGDSRNLTDFYGEGLTANYDEAYSQQNLVGGSRDNENFGYALATGDFNGDSRDDLAVGVPNDVQTAGQNRSGGSVNIIYGTPYVSAPFWEGGLTNQVGYNYLYHQDSTDDGFDIYGVAEDGDRFGHSLASGDFNNDGDDDLAIGVPGEDISGVNDTGGVAILYGGNVQYNYQNGLHEEGNQFFSQATPGVNGASEEGDQFGYTLAVGDMNSDGVDDLIIGTPLEDIDDVVNAGAVSIFFGQEGVGLSSANDISFSQKSLGNPGFATEDFRFGYSLAVGDFDCDGKDDLAIGSQGSHGLSFFTEYFEGSVTIIYQQTHDLISRLPMEPVTWESCDF